MHPNGRNRYSAITDYWKSACNFETVEDRRDRVWIEHEQKTMVAISAYDFISGLKPPFMSKIDIPSLRTIENMSLA